MTSLNTDPLVFLRDALEKHGLAVVRQSQRLDVEGGRLQLEAEIFDFEAKSGFTVSLEVRVFSDALGGEPIIECFAGVGDSRDKAISDAFGNMLLGTFHVLIESLTSHSCPEGQAEIENWRRDDAAWRVYSGPLLTRHSGDSTLAPCYSGVLSRLEHLFAQTVAAGPHWVRVFVGAYHGQIQVTEALLDNEPWEPAVSILASTDWACTNEYQSIRHFMIALPDDRTRT